LKNVLKEGWRNVVVRAKSIMIQGTASSVGKSLITAGLCRIFHQDGYRVVPFKSQNMASNSYITAEGLEMSRAQEVQAEAAGVEPDVRMNPILLKPATDKKSRVIINGKAHGDMSAMEYHNFKPQLRDMIKTIYDQLALENDMVVIEGAGSPAEINLVDRDIVNMGMAEIADAPVLLVGDIDRGGVFASLAGTMLLLPEKEKQRVKGVIINKFRGDLEILRPGISMIEEIIHVPVIGVIPYAKFAIDEEDSASEKFSAFLRDKKGPAFPDEKRPDYCDFRQSEYERLAQLLRQHLDIVKVYEIMNSWKKGTA
jgi:adenosylcobyric acid synthase